MKVDGINFECTKCGDCCRWGGYVFLTDVDIGKLRTKEGLSLFKFLSKYTKEKQIGGEVKRVLANKEGSTECVFLDGNSCSVNDIKPHQCSEYPIKYEEGCEGFNAEGNKMASKYEEAVKEVNRKLSGDTSEKSIIADLFNSLGKNKSVASVLSKVMDSGIDVYLKDDRVKIASLADLYAFTRVGSNHLVHKATKDLWALEESVDGSIVINRLFDDSGNPIRS